MNRKAITQAAKDFLTEYKGATAAGSPHAWGLIVSQAANDVARRLGCFYTQSIKPLANGVSDYSPGNIYAPKRIICADGTGSSITLLPMTMDDLNRWGVVMGFVQANGTLATGIPSQYIWLAANLLRLVPVPNYAAAAGLVVEGLGYPSNTWPSPLDECPLPLEAHPSVVYRASVLRSAQFPDAENKARSAQLAAVYETEIGSAQAALRVTMESQADRMVDGRPDAAAAYPGAI